MPNPKLNKLYQLYKDNQPELLGGMDEKSFVTKFSDNEKLGKLFDITNEHDAEILGGLQRDQYIAKFGENGATKYFTNQLNDMQNQASTEPRSGVSSPKALGKVTQEETLAEKPIQFAQESTSNKPILDPNLGKNPFELVDLKDKDPLQEGVKNIRNYEERKKEGDKANPERTTYNLGMEAINNSYNQANSNIDKVKIFVNNQKGKEDAFDDYMADLQAVSNSIDSDPEKKNPNTNKLIDQFNKEWGDIQNSEMVGKYLFPSLDFLGKMQDSRNKVKDSVPNYTKYLDDIQKEQAESDKIDYTTGSGFLKGAANKLKRVIGGTFLGNIAAIGKGLTDSQVFYDIGEYAKQTEELNPSATRHQRSTVEDYVHDEETGLDMVFDDSVNGQTPQFQYFVDPKTGNMANVIMTDALQKKIDQYAKDKKFESRRVGGAIVSQGVDELIEELPELALTVATDGLLSAGMKGLRAAKITSQSNKILRTAKTLANTKIAKDITAKHVGAHVGELLSGTIEGSADYREEGLKAGLSEDEVSAFQLAAGLNAGISDAINPMEVMALKKDIDIFFKKKLADYAAGKITKTALLKETGASFILNTSKNLAKETVSEGIVEPLIGNKIRKTFNELKGTDFKETDINPRSIEAGFWLSAVSSGAFSVPTSMRVSKGGLMADAIKYAVNNPEELQAYFKGRRAAQGGQALDRENYLKSVIDQVNDAGLSKPDKEQAALLMIDRQNASLEVEELEKKYGADAPLVKKKRNELFDIEGKIDDIFSKEKAPQPEAPAAPPKAEEEAATTTEKAEPVAKDNITSLPIGKSVDLSEDKKAKGDKATEETPPAKEESQFDLSKQQKYTLNRAAKDKPQAPKIESDLVDWEKSGIEDNDFKDVKILETRGNNQDGIPVGTVSAKNSEGIWEDFEVFFKPGSKKEVIPSKNITDDNDLITSNKINGRLLNEKQAAELQKEIENNFTPEGGNPFAANDIRSSLYNLDNPLAEKTVNNVNLKITDGLPRKDKDGNSKKSYLLYADNKIVGEFDTPQDAKKTVKLIEDNLIKTLPSGAKTTADSKKTKPIRQLGTGANVYFESDSRKYRVNDDSSRPGKVLLNIGNRKDESILDSVEFDNAEEAVFVAKKIEESEPYGLTDNYHNIEKIVNRFKEEYKESKKEPTQKTTDNKNKVVDAKGNPLTLYHGTKVNVSSLKPGVGMDESGAPQVPGIYLTDNKDAANWYALQEDDDRFLKHVNVNMTNPLVVSGNNELIKQLGIKSLSEAKDAAKKLGHDGIIIENGFYTRGGPHKAYIAFDSDQVKIIAPPKSKEPTKADKIANIPFDQRTDKEHADYVRQKFVDQFTAKGTPKAQIDAALAKMEERAKKEYPGNPDAFYRKIQDVIGGKKAEPQTTSSPKQENLTENEQEAEKPRNTETIIAEGEAVIAEAEAIGETETAPTQEEDVKIVQTVAKIERIVNEIESKVGKLTESYSTEDIAHEYPNKVIGQKAKKEITKYAKEIAKLTGWTIPAKNGVYDNIAPAGGDVSIHFDIPGTDLQIYATVKYDPSYSDHYDDYKFDGFFYRVENPKLKGTATFVGPNRWEKQNKTAKEFAEILSKEAKPYIEKALAQKKDNNDLADLREKASKLQKEDRTKELHALHKEYMQSKGSEGKTIDNLVTKSIVEINSPGGLKLAGMDFDVQDEGMWFVDSMTIEGEKVDVYAHSPNKGENNWVLRKPNQTERDFWDIKNKEQYPNQFPQMLQDILDFNDKHGKDAFAKIEDGLLANNNAVNKSILAPTKKTIENSDKKAEVDKAIDEIWNYFGQSGIATSPEQQAKDLEMGIKLVGLYLKKGYYKLEDIVNAGVEKLGVEKMNSLLQYIKNGYLAYQSDATDEEIDKMDDTRTVRNYTIKPNNKQESKKSEDVVDDTFVDGITYSDGSKVKKSSFVLKETNGIKRAVLSLGGFYAGERGFGKVKPSEHLFLNQGEHYGRVNLVADADFIDAYRFGANGIKSGISPAFADKYSKKYGFENTADLYQKVKEIAKEDREKNSDIVIDFRQSTLNQLNSQEYERKQEPVTGPEAEPIDQEEPVAEPEPVTGEETKPDQEKISGRGTKPGTKLGGKKLDKAPKRQLPDLFSGITEGGDTDSDSDQNAGGIRRKPKGIEEPELSTGGSRGSGEGDVISTGIDRENFTPAEDKPGEIVLLGHPEENFVVDETTIPQSFSPKTRFTANLDALKLLATLRKEKRHATKSEQEILSKYVGWGGLKVVLNPIAGTWTKSDEELRPLVNELHEVISDLESTGLKGALQSIKRSVLSAFYTPLGVIRGMYTAIEQFGFTGGHILDPSAGIGHFTGAMPGSIRGESKLTHIELDVLTGEILKNLYPNSNTEVTGFENAKIPKNYFDLIISNIPFGDNMGVYDSSFSTPELKGFTNAIHNYFFAKAIQQAKEGGLIAFVTSTGVMDSPSNKPVRQYINNNTEFIGAIRLPESTFKGNANTQVVSDIVFLRKKSNPSNNPAFLNDKMLEVEHEKSGDKKFINVNEYFANNPTHVIGEFKAGWNNGEDKMVVVAPKNVDLQREIERIVKNNFPIGIYSQEKQYTDIEDDVEEGVTEQFKAAKKSEIYIESDGKGYVKIDDYSEKVALPKSYSIAKVNAFIELREALKNQYQVEGEGVATESEIETSRRRLNESYNRFISKHGLLHKKDNQPLLNKDINGFNILSLEKDKTGTKADIFSRRVIQGKRHLTSAANIDDAISISINDHGYVNIQRIGSLLNQDPIKIVEDNYGVLFYDTDGAVVTRSEYLSGNVKKKLSEAIELAKENPIYEANIKELRNVIPEDIAASDIEVNVGARWVMTKYYEQFASEIFKTPVNIHYSAAGDKYTVKANTHTVEITNEHGVYRTTGEKRIAKNGLELLEAAMHNVVPVVTYQVSKDPDKYETDKEATANAQEKQDRIKEMFSEWIWQDEKRRTELGRIYNDLFNTTIKRTHDGSKLTIDGLNNVTLRPHQLDAIMMLINNKGGIIDHIVGAGKTYVMIAAAIKMKQIGIANKPTIIGLKSTIPHLVEDAKNAFPNAKILTPTESDFSAKNRKKFLSKIQNNDWDLIIMSHEQFGTIPQDNDIQIESINEEIDLLDQELQNALDDGTAASKAALKGLEKRKENLENKLKKLLDAPKDQEILNFKQIGIDHLMVDESQMFKNLEYATKINRIAGLGNKTGSKRAFNMLIAARTLQKMHNVDKGVTFSSGTVISNSLVEMYLLFKYLRPDKMKELGYNTFDSWVTQFAVAKTEVEFSVSSDLKQKVRFRSFINLPELSMLYNEISDVRNDSNLELPKPKIKKTLDPDGKLVRAPELIAVKQSEYQKEWTKRIIEFSNQKYGKRDGTLIGKGPLSDKEQAAAMLLVTGISSKLSVDMRLIDPNAEDNPNGKLSAVAEKAANIFHETTPQKSTQLIFSDIGTPKTANTIENLKSYLEDELNLGTDDIEAIFGDDPEKLPQKKTVIERMKNVMEWTDEEIEDHIKASRETEGQFNVYAELKRKLVAKGVPEDQVVFIHDYKTKKAKQALFEKVKMGEIRIVIGSTQKLGTGVNVQHKLIAAHHVDAPWNPAAMEQRNGRIIRQKNENPEVGIYNYGTELTLDAYKYQLIASKLRFINQIKQGASNSRVQDEGDGDEVTSQMMVAILSGNPLILKLAKVEAVLNRLRRSKKTFTAEFQKTETLKNATEARIPIVKEEVAKREIDYKTITAKGVDENGKVKPIVEFSPAVGYESTKELGQIINDKKKALLNKPLGHATLIAKVNGLELFGKPVRTESLSNIGIFAEIEVKLYLKGEFNYDVTSSVDPTAQGTAIGAAINRFKDAIEHRKSDIERDEQNVIKYANLLNNKWEKQDELDEAEAEFKRINKILFDTAKENEKNIDEAQAAAEGSTDGKLRDNDLVYEPHDKDVFISVVPGKNTITGQDVYLARINDQLSPESYAKNVKPLINKYGGEWNRSSGNIIFYDRNNAASFKNDIENDFNVQNPQPLKFQKSQQTLYYENQLAEDEKRLTDAKKKLASKRSELYKIVAEDQADLFGERKSQTIPRLFDERADTDVESKLEELKRNVAAAQAKVNKTKDNLEKSLGTTDNLLFQKTEPTPSGIINVDEITDISEFIDNFFGPIETPETHFEEIETTAAPAGEFVYTPGFNWYSDGPAFVSGYQADNPTVYDAEPKEEKIIKVRRGRSIAKSKRKIKNPKYKKALEIIPGSAEDYVKQALIGGYKIHSDIIKNMFPKRKDPKTGEEKYATGEVSARIGLINNTTGFKKIGDLAERLWSDQVTDIGGEIYTDQDFATAIEDVLLAHNGTLSMVENLLEKYYPENSQEADEEIIINEQQESANEDQEIDEIWDYFKKIDQQEEKHIPTQQEIDEGVYDKDGNFILFQKTDMTPSSNESIAERIQKIKCP